MIQNKTKQNRRNQGQETIIKEEVIGIFFFNIFWCFFKNFARVLVEVQFLGYKFGLKGSTYTQEKTVILCLCSTLWNSLPNDIRQSDTLNTSRS